MNTSLNLQAAPTNRRLADRRVFPPVVSAPNGALLLMKVLDEIDHGLVLVDRHGRLCFANQLAWHDLSGDGALMLIGERVTGRTTADHSALQAALVDAQRGRRRLFNAGVGSPGAVSVAAVPMALGADDPASEGSVLLVFGKRQAVEGLTADFFARAHSLTSAETAVLKSLCGGRKPKEIALAQQVKVSTIRSHISSIRAKTEAGSIADLVNRVAVLPPMTPAVKSRSGAAPRFDVVFPSQREAPADDELSLAA